MKDYMLSGLVTVEVTTRVRARSLEEAIRIAAKRNVSHRVALDQREAEAAERRRIERERRAALTPEQRDREDGRPTQRRLVRELVLLAAASGGLGK